ncbi:hypothetical protein MAPG_05107 [Magnaporthiopsis poae ATCC 64411]|uniref:Spherulin-4 n=1 Tax=Magnaporthiopsis poae (strain ATCC 64411 / 73-15) TaxID=644358 RepID=A0A0C4DYI5_MAGP6|nr:hypothetical protein MAPG_05107 [Magnaporthiopsis poae ATCC 64411]
MKSFLLPALALGLSHLATATNISLPLYVRPSVEYNDNASNWQSLLSTIRSHRNVLFDVIINDDSGPGTTPDDVNFAAGVGLLNAEPNARTLGYVHTGYGNISQDVVVANVTRWAAWKAVLPQNVETYFGLANASVIVFEGTWATYQGANPIRDNIPAGRAAQSSILVHTFDGTLAQLEAELGKMSAAGVGFTWFAQRVNDPNVFSNYTTPPANAENQASILSGLAA